MIRAYYQDNRPAAKQALKRAIEIPVEVYASTQRLLRLAESLTTTVPARYRVDLQCAVALARAAGEAARLLVMTNLVWLGDRTYRLHTQHKLARLR